MIKKIVIFLVDTCCLDTLYEFARAGGGSFAVANAIVFLVGYAAITYQDVLIGQFYYNSTISIQFETLLWVLQEIRLNVKFYELILKIIHFRHFRTPEELKDENFLQNFFSSDLSAVQIKKYSCELINVVMQYHTDIRNHLFLPQLRLVQMFTFVPFNEIRLFLQEGSPPELLSPYITIDRLNTEISGINTPINDVFTFFNWNFLEKKMTYPVGDEITRGYWLIEPIFTYIFGYQVFMEAMSRGPSSYSGIYLFDYIWRNHSGLLFFYYAMEDGIYLRQYYETIFYFGYYYCDEILEFNKNMIYVYDPSSISWFKSSLTGNINWNTFKNYDYYEVEICCIWEVIDYTAFEDSELNRQNFKEYYDYIVSNYKKDIDPKYHKFLSFEKEIKKK